MKISEPIHSLSAKIDRAHEEKQSQPRPHFGASMAGHSCRRFLWLNFRWAVKPSFPGRILRLFRRGHYEENFVVEDLRMSGLVVNDVDENGKQFWVNFGSHFSGSTDGIIESGVPEAPNKRHVLEIKTHSKKSFDDLLKKGLEISKPMHWIQVQLYLHGTGIDRGQYVAVCKDDDRLYTERVKYDKALAEKYIDRSRDIIASDRMPEPLSADPTWYECKFCDAWDQCHGSKTTKHVNCRTCAHSTAQRDGTWHCARWDSEIPAVEFQRAGCEDHVIHPDLVPWKIKGGDEFSAVYESDGVEFRNGVNGLLSRDLLNPDQNIGDLVKRFGGRVC